MSSSTLHAEVEEAVLLDAPLDLAHWDACVALASVALWYDEIRKLVLRASAKCRR